MLKMHLSIDATKVVLDSLIGEYPLRMFQNVVN
jgi:hypothetical protein